MTHTGSDCPAAAHFTRVTEAVVTLSELAAGPHGGGLAEALAGDDLALARMWAAADVLRATGMPAELLGADWADGDLVRRAAIWQQYAGGPVTPLHSACGRDMARGLLRVWARRGNAGAGARSRDLGRTRLRQARVQLSSRIRTRCAALRAELRDDAGSLRRGQTAAFTRRAISRAAGVARELQEAIDFDLGGAGVAPPAAVDVDPPAPRISTLENRLTWLIGTGFSTGTTLTLARLLSEALPAGGAVVGTAAAAGVIIGAVVVRTRMLLCQRAAVDRWVLELTATLRAALDEHLATRVLAAAASRAPSRPIRDYTCD